MSNQLRQKVLRAFKELHKARKVVFRGDVRALDAARVKINEEFKKNKGVKDGGALNEMVKYSYAVADELRKSVVQAEEINPGVFYVKIRPETTKLDNMPFNPDAELPKRGTRRGGGCCQEQT